VTVTIGAGATVQGRVWDGKPSLARNELTVSAELVDTMAFGGASAGVGISSRGTRVQGSVVDKDGLPAAGVWVVAVPDEPRRAMLQFLNR
jgi:hypothetical protein